jgi:hypothetical protein
MRIRSLVALVLCLAAAALFGEEDTRTTVEVHRAASSITVDGDLSDAAWQNATKYEKWYETNVGDNVEPPVKQVGYVTYDDHFLYVGIDMWDPSPKDIASIYGDHDNISGNTDDYAGLLIDTRYDSKSGYLFLVNARGVQYDASTDDASGEDNSPDFYWDSAAKRNDHGWSVEMRIPFSSLRYEGSAPKFHIALYRNRPRDRRYQIFTDRLPRGGNCFVCRWSSATGFAGLPSGGHIVAAPYVTARSVGETRDDIGSPIVQRPVGTDAGLDVKWKPNAQTAVDATLNPDFSQVESDTAAISTNERFAIFFPEKRPFFLEGTELFSTPIQAVYTRSITKPRFGIRSTGKIGSNAYTLLVADDRGGGSIILPSAFGSNFANQDFSSLALIGRVRHDYGKNSFASFLVTTREDDGGGHNRVFGPDFRWNTEHNTVTGQLLMSQTQTPNRPDLSSQWDGRSMQSYAGDLWWQWNTPKNDFFIEGKSFGDDFRADNGFVPQVGYRSAYAEVGHTYRPTTGFFNRIRIFSMSEYDALQDGSTSYRMVSGGFGADGKHRSFIRLRYVADDVRNRDLDRGIDTVFSRHQLRYQVQFAVNRYVTSVGVNGWVGQNVDFSNNRLARGANINLNADIRPTEHLDVAIIHSQSFLREPVTTLGSRQRLFTSQVERVRAMYTFNSRMFVRAILQNERTARNPTLYGRNLNTRVGDFASQALFAYKINWQTLMYVGVGDVRETDPIGDLQPSTRQYFAKVSYAFQR